MKILQLPVCGAISTEYVSCPLDYRKESNRGPVFSCYPQRSTLRQSASSCRSERTIPLYKSIQSESVVEIVNRSGGGFYDLRIRFLFSQHLKGWPQWVSVFCGSCSVDVFPEQRRCSLLELASQLPPPVVHQAGNLFLGVSLRSQLIQHTAQRAHFCLVGQAQRVALDSGFHKLCHFCFKFVQRSTSFTG